MEVSEANAIVDEEIAAALKGLPVREKELLKAMQVIYEDRILRKDAKDIIKRLCLKEIEG